MQLIEKYAGKLIDRVFDCFGNETSKYETESFQKGMGEGKVAAYSTEKLRLEGILDYLEDESLKLTFLAAAAQYLYPDFYHMLKKITGQSVTLQLGLRLSNDKKIWTYPENFTGFKALREYLRVEKRNENFLYTELYADERLMLYLMGYDEPPEAISSFSTLYFTEDTNSIKNSDADEIYRRMVLAQDLEKNYIFQLCGERGRGRKTLLKSIADKTGHGWVFVDYSKLEKMDQKEYEEVCWLIFREAVFYSFGVCFYGFSQDFTSKKSVEPKRFTNILRKIKPVLFYPVCICTEINQEIIPVSDYPVYRYLFKPCTVQERIDIWIQKADDEGLILDAEKYGSFYKLNPGDIQKIIDGMTIENCNSMSEENRDYYVAGLVQSMRKSPEKGSLKPVSSGYSIDDLKLEQKQIDALENICAYVKHNHKVYDVWDMGRHFDYGRAVTALFCGPPGTGKSMAARVLSNELKMPLYRIDLSQVVDKYIGETEKKLEEIFSYAQNSNVILFFDEADSIFGKRTEVKEAKDKYANTEVSYLLQRIEEYDGMVLLATNLKNNIDEAFMRRMKYVVDFKLPDVKTRREIWVGNLTGKVNLSNIDFDYLAQKIELSGGYIKNIIQNALFLAAKEGDSVNMKHILQSAGNEYLKLGKLITPADFEKYAYILM
jgi:hypothetical protein